MENSNNKSSRRVRTVVSVLALLLICDFQNCTSNSGGGAFNLNSGANGNNNTSSSTTPYVSPTPTTSPTPRATPVPSPTPVLLTDVSVGGDHACAIYNGGIQCWGDNTEFDLGDNTQTQRLNPVQILPAGSHATALPNQFGAYFSCAVVNGGAMCWGDTSDGEGGQGSAGNTTFTCASKGNFTYSNGAMAQTVPAYALGLGAGSGVTAIGGDDFATACAIVNGGVRCWGENFYGQLGNGSVTCSPQPVAVSGLSGATQVAGGDTFMCAVANGGAYCWGGNADGQLGVTPVFCSTAGDDCSLTPVQVTGLPPGSGVIQVAAGVSHACALKNTGAVECWGNNASGQLGNGTTTSSDFPVAVTGLSSGVVQIAASYSTTCAVKSDGSAYCWGANSDGQMGTGNANGSTTPVQISGFNPGAGVTDLRIGFESGIAIVNGIADVWGTGSGGVLGQGNANNSFTPIPVTLLP